MNKNIFSAIKITNNRQLPFHWQIGSVRFIRVVVLLLRLTRTAAMYGCTGLLVSIILTGCEKEVTNIKIPQSPPKLAIAAFISPQDTILRVSVVKSAPVLGTSRLTPENIKDATVTLSDGTNTVILPFNENERVYTTDAKSLSVLPGKIYFLNVSNPEGLQASASCTVPLSQNNTLEILKELEDEGLGTKSHVVELRWTDTPGEINYYRASLEIQSVFTYTRPDTRKDTTIIRYDNLLWGTSPLYSDNRLDGSGFVSPKGKIYNMEYIDKDPNVHYAAIIGHLLNTDEHYFRYHQSVRNNNNENPFAEPTPIYSNVEGGLGVFAAYNRSLITLKIK